MKAGWQLPGPRLYGSRFFSVPLSVGGTRSPAPSNRPPDPGPEGQPAGGALPAGGAWLVRD